MHTKKGERLRYVTLNRSGSSQSARVDGTDQIADALSLYAHLRRQHIVPYLSHYGETRQMSLYHQEYIIARPRVCM